METSPAIEAARHLLSVIWDGSTPTDEELAAALDRLAGAYHLAPPGVASALDVDPPEDDWTALHQQVAARFPTYGLYPVADTTAAMDQALMMGDAADDLADITRDLRETIWRFDNLGVQDAHWSLQLLYFHWGRHMRGLALYLHDRQFG
jgi:hypothetical protein